MKKYWLNFVLITMLLPSCSAFRRAEINLHTGNSETAAAFDFSAPETWLLGYVNQSLFYRAPHSEWYLKGFENYVPDQEAMVKLTEILNGNDITVKIVLGTWCPDSRREVPRFMKIMSELGFPSEKLTFIGVDGTKNSPVGEYADLGIERVPTFIFFRNKIESGRIIENPVTSLEQDMLNILTRNEK